MTIIVTTSLLLHIILYFVASRKEQGFINIFSPKFGFAVIFEHILPLIYNKYISGWNFSVVSVFFVYSSLFVSNLIFVVSYYHAIKSKAQIKIPYINNMHSRKIRNFLLIGSICFFAPILLEYYYLLPDTRRIYEVTRTGYGLFYFGSLFMANLYFACCLIEKKYLLSIIFALANAFLHGTKGAIMMPAILGLYYLLLVKNVKFSFYRSIVVIGFITIVLAKSFSLFSRNDLPLIMKLVSYSNYTYNATMLVDSFDHNFKSFFWGTLTIEDNFYARIPRSIYPDKPKNFGRFLLSETYYPEWFEGDTGSPSFGSVGVPYADFGYLALIYLAVRNYLFGFSAGLIKKSIDRKFGLGAFIMFLFFIGVPLVSIGSGNLLPEHIIVAFIVGLVGHIHLGERARKLDKLDFDRC